MFSWTFGGNYIDAFDKTNPLLYQLRAANAAAPYVDTDIPQNINTQLAKTYGIFGGAYLKLFSRRLTLSAEGRYQWDKRGAYSLNYLGVPVTGTQFSGTFRSFNPRVSADFDLGFGTKVYASYASGTRPGGFNGAVASAITRVGVAAVQAAFGLSSPSYAEERLRIGELGLKGTFDNRRGFFDINTYYGKLTNQQINFTAVLIQPNGTPEAFSTTATANVGEATAYGLEAQANYALMKELSLSGTFSWNHTRRDKFDNFSGIPEFGTRNLDGVAFYATPQFSGSANATYERPISSKFNFFVTPSYVYRGKMFADVANLSYIKGRSQVDLRTGITNDTLTVELFVTNLFNDQNYTGGTVAQNFDNLQTYAFFGGWAPPRTVGARIHVKIK